MAGNAAEKQAAQGSEVITKATELLNCKQSELVSYATALFQLWKKGRKASKKGKEFDPTLKVENNEIIEGSDSEILEQVANIFRVQPEHIPKTIERFQNEIKGFADNKQ